MRCRVLGWLTLAASAFAVAAAARAEPPLTLRDIRALPTPALALRLLGPERGADIVRIEGVPDARVRASVLQVFLYARPVPLGSNYCSQRRYYRALASAASGEIGPLRRGQPLRILAGWEEPTLARAPGCRLAAGQRFASIREPDVAMRALDDLASAREAARATGPMTPLQLTCRDEVAWDPDRCLAGGREVLAQLPLEGACRVDAVDGDSQVVEVTLCTGGPLWELRLRAAGPAPVLSMLWKDSTNY